MNSWIFAFHPSAPVLPYILRLLLSLSWTLSLKRSNSRGDFIGLVAFWLMCFQRRKQVVVKLWFLVMHTKTSKRKRKARQTKINRLPNNIMAVMMLIRKTVSHISNLAKNYFIPHWVLIEPKLSQAVCMLYLMKINITPWYSHIQAFCT